MVSAYHNQGKEANVDGFKIGRRPTILKVNTDNLSQDLYMFSPEWMKMNSVVLIDEDEIALKLNA